MKQTVFTGVATALITPLDEKGIDFKQFEKVINWQIENKADALVICGTTGEGSTLSDEEHKKAVEFSVKVADKRVPIIAGTGSNDTDYAINLTKFCCSAGADAMLVVTPYYNKATQNGLVKMYNAIADASTKPVILYNVPSRTGVNIAPSTYVEIAKHPMICGLKEANGDISKIAETMALIGDTLDVYSGNDDQIVPIMALGGKGVISVLSNLIPKETHELCEKMLNGQYKEAAKMQLDYIPLINALFSEVNPIPVKAAMARMGFCKDYLRLPLTPMEDENKKILFECMQKIGL